MLGRGPLRNPFLFLEAFLNEDELSPFTPLDYFEVVKVYLDYFSNWTDRDRTVLVQMRKMIVWLAAGFSEVASFRNRIFTAETIEETIGLNKRILSCSHGFWSLSQED